MAKYRAKVDVPPGIKAGDVVNFEEPLVPSYEKLFEKVGESDDEDDDADKTFVGNPDRNTLKDRATELGINFAPNIPTDRLIELITEAEVKAAAGGE